ncbi:MAG: transposase, partial [Sandaracinus sp.]|nr:transposase [Sandaracinus sp.]
FTDVLVQATNDRDVEAIAMTYKERLIEQGREEGLERGLEQGRAEGSRLMLAKLLQLKFGPLDDATEAKLAGASLAQLEAWSERVLTADDLDQVFAS